jgi:hypothetical protein
MNEPKLTGLEQELLAALEKANWFLFRDHNFS